MDLPFSRVVGSLDGVTPLHQSGLFTHVDFLATADQTDHHTPLGNSFGELNEIFWFRLPALKSRCGRVLDLNLKRVKRTLCFIKDKNMFWRNQCWARGVGLHVILDSTHEGLAPTTGAA
jgi:hypothetical protein